MEIIGLILAVLAMLIGIWHLAEIRRTMVRLDEVRGSLSTRYLGQFPEFIPEIVSHLQRAKRKITIFCDFPAYGHFSDRRSWLNYGQTIKNKTFDKVHVSLTCFDEARRYDFNTEQFSQVEEGWDEWKRDPQIERKLKELLVSRGKDADVDALTKKEFAKLLEDTEQDMLLDEFLNAEKVEVNKDIPLYFWIIDDAEAIFAIPSFSDETTEYGFFTSDPKLISAFQQIVKRYHRNPLHFKNM
jgi:hypothetical protein